VSNGTQKCPSDRYLISITSPFLPSSDIIHNSPFPLNPELHQSNDLSRRLLLAISGIPGSGKSQLANLLVKSLNTQHHETYAAAHPNQPPGPAPSNPDIAIVIPLDGFHLTRAQLSSLPNAEEAIFRRGAAFTFDALGYFVLVQKLRAPLEATTPTIYAPSFDHAIKDPVANDIGIPASARIVVFEGLYTALDRSGGWREAAELMDEVWAVEVGMAVAEARVAKRNFAAGISSSLEESLSRARESDMRNARDVLENRVEVQEVVRSVEDEEWRSDEVEEAVMEEDEGKGLDRDGQGKPGRERLDSIAELAASGAGW
jgi:pantothenate kinase